MTFQGDHNTRRPPFFYSSVSIFFHNTLSRAEAIAVTITRLLTHPPRCLALPA